MGPVCSEHVLNSIVLSMKQQGGGSSLTIYTFFMIVLIYHMLILCSACYSFVLHRLMVSFCFFYVPEMCVNILLRDLEIVARNYGYYFLHLKMQFVI